MTFQDGMIYEYQEFDKKELFFTLNAMSIVTTGLK